MTFNIPPKVRIALYILTIIGTPVMAYLKAKGIVGDLEINLWSAEVVAVAGMAALNVKPDKE
jgi:hypothetical protein